jgi:hypothetical protein
MLVILAGFDMLIAIMANFTSFVLVFIFNYCSELENTVIFRTSRWCIRKFPDWVDNEIYAYNNKHSLKSNTKGYGGKTH